MDWLRRCHAVIVCDEKLVQIPYGNETLIFHGNESNNRRESRLTIISCSKVRVHGKRMSALFEQISPRMRRTSRKERTLKDRIVQNTTARAFDKVFIRQFLNPLGQPGLVCQKEDGTFRMCIDLPISKVQFPSHVIDSRGIYVDPAKIESIKDWASLKTPTEIHQFLGLAGYYRRLELPQKLSRVHHTFHVSNLNKCYADEPLVMSLEGIHVDDKLQFMEEPIEIMEWEIKRLKRSRIPLVKVRWNSRRGPEFTWECEDSFKQKYPQLFTNRASSSTTRS
ncbi:hypothetical protein Tco_0954592 [Tanacetum coccineum]|uniref:Reverse transcriptase domain-containing protein n=1 Tax=Tanacetum coccineum TaxID=301880 RepID=A0ABQ5E4U4_9ASTR